MGASASTLFEAAKALNQRPGISIHSLSSLYYSAPVGGVAQPEYCNQVARVATTLSPFDLLVELLEVEQLFGRVRIVRWGPRTLDLDLLFFDNVVMDSPRLTIPHPRLAERGFVLAPLVEIAPELRHPLLGLTAKQLYMAWAGNVQRPQEHIRRVAAACPLSSAGNP